MIVDEGTYNRIFIGHGDGVAILDELKTLYGGKSHTPGDTHETAFKEGQRAVVAFITRKSEIQEGE